MSMKSNLIGYGAVAAALAVIITGAYVRKHYSAPKAPVVITEQPVVKPAPAKKSTKKTTKAPLVITPVPVPERFEPVPVPRPRWRRECDISGFCMTYFG